MINGCGATTMMEMLVLFKDTVEFLKAKGIEVVASMVGEILTVQEAGRLSDEHRQVGRGDAPSVEHPLPHPGVQ